MRYSTSINILLFFLLSTSTLHPQLKFAEQSQLSKAQYLEHQIKSISDVDLFGALQMNSPALKGVKDAAQHKDFVQAYRAWGKYWRAKQQPKYATRTYELLIDTDMLNGYEEIRAYVSSHKEERDTILARAALILKNIFRPWGDVLVDFGSKVDFNREIGQSGKYGFHYWMWSRALILAYLITEDQKYLAKFDELFQNDRRLRKNLREDVLRDAVIQDSTTPSIP
jgi:hypothetical protein